MAAVALHAAETSPALAVILVVGGLGAALVAGLALAAVARRRSVPYVLVALAVVTVVARAVVGVLSLQDAIDPGRHHLVEHGLDVVMVALVVAAVVTVRRATRA